MYMVNMVARAPTTATCTVVIPNPERDVFTTTLCVVHTLPSALFDGTAAKT